MKIRQKNRAPKKMIIVYTAIFIVLLISTLLFLFINKPFSDKSTVKNDTTSNDSGLTDIDNKAESNNESTEEVDTSLTTGEVPESESVSISIESLDHSDGKVNYKAIAKGATTGRCSANFTNTIGKPVIKVSDTSNGICSGSYLEQEFDALGEWDLTVYFYTNNTQASAKGKVNVE